MLLQAGFVGRRARSHAPTLALRAAPSRPCAAPGTREREKPRRLARRTASCRQPQRQHAVWQGHEGRGLPSGLCLSRPRVQQPTSSTTCTPHSADAGILWRDRQKWDQSRSGASCSGSPGCCGATALARSRHSSIAAHTVEHHCRSVVWWAMTSSAAITVGDSTVTAPWSPSPPSARGPRCQALSRLARQQASSRCTA